MTALKMFNVRSNWPVSAPSLGDESHTQEDPSFLFDKCLKLHQGAFDFDPESMVEVESCVQLNSPENEKKCQVTFECLAQNIFVSRLVLVSQCKRIELYSSQGEYKITKEGVLLGMAFTVIKCKLEQRFIFIFSIIQIPKITNI